MRTVKQFLNHFVVLMLLFLSWNNLLAQKKSILIYTDDVPYMFPYIEEALKKMVDRSNDTLVFEEVVNLTRALENEKDEQVTEDLIAILGQSRLLVNQQFSDFKFNLSKRIIDFDYFLKVNYHEVDAVVEVQMYLYKIVQKDYSDGEYLWRIVNNIEEYEGVTDFFVDIRARDFKKEVDKNLKGLFPQTNLPPELRIYAGDQYNPRDLYINVGDSILLDLSYSVDPDDNLDDLLVEIKQIENSSADEIPDSLKVKISSDQLRQYLSFQKAATYSFSIRLYDGVSYSELKELRIQVFPQQLVYLSQNRIEFAIREDDLRESHPFSFNVINVSSNANIWDCFEIHFQRRSPTILNEKEKEIVRVADKNAEQSVADLLKFPLNLEYEISYDSATIEVSGEIFTPRDKLHQNFYSYDVWLSCNGIKTNLERLEIDFWKYGNSFVDFGIEAIPTADRILPINSDGLLGASSPPSSFDGSRLLLGTHRTGYYGRVFLRLTPNSFGGMVFSDVLIGQREFKTIARPQSPADSILFIRETNYRKGLELEYAREVYRSTKNTTLLGISLAFLGNESDNYGFRIYDNVNLSEVSALEIANAEFSSRNFDTGIVRPIFFFRTLQRVHRNIFFSGTGHIGILQGKAFSYLSLGLSFNITNLDGSDEGISIFSRNLRKK